mmetsp:Transcript_15814/g.23478  ORF Transcript_15814/g.23478 Transcript_15814/m.23478 type:complete len:317 (+) Transcript_15814:1028-1978(+)
MHFRDPYFCPVLRSVLGRLAASHSACRFIMSLGIGTALKIPHQFPIFLRPQQSLHLRGQLVVHHGAVLVSHQSPSVGGLEQVPGTPALAHGRSAVPGVGRDDQHGPGRTRRVQLRMLRGGLVGAGPSEAVAPLNDAGSPVSGRPQVVQKVHARQRQRRANDAGRQRSTVRRLKGRGVVRVPPRRLPPPSRIDPKGVVVDQVRRQAGVLSRSCRTALAQQSLDDRKDRLVLEHPQAQRRVVLENALVHDVLLAVVVAAILALLLLVVSVDRLSQLGDRLRVQHARDHRVSLSQKILSRGFRSRQLGRRRDGGCRYCF